MRFKSNPAPERAMPRGNLWTVYEVQQGPLAGLGFGVFARCRRAGELKNSCLLPGYGRVDAAATYSFGLTGTETKRYRVAVNLQNLLDHRYYESGKTQTVIYPGTPVNMLTEFQIRF